MSDIFKSVFDAWDERIRSPILGSIAFVYFAFYWKPLFVLFFSTDPASERMAEFNQGLEPWCWVAAVPFVEQWIWPAMPLLLGLLLAFISPWIKFGGAWIAKWANECLARLQEGEASEKRKRLYEKEAEELEKKTDRDVAIVESQGRIREAEENRKIRDSERLQQAEELGADVKEDILSSRDQSPRSLAASITNLERMMLKNAALGKRATISHRKYLGGQTFFAGSHEIIQDGTPQAVADIEHAIENLESLGLVRETGGKKEIYKVTKLGFEVAGTIEEE